MCIYTYMHSDISRFTIMFPVAHVSLHSPVEPVVAAPKPLPKPPDVIADAPKPPGGLSLEPPDVFAAAAA